MAGLTPGLIISWIFFTIIVLAVTFVIGSVIKSFGLSNLNAYEYFAVGFVALIGLTEFLGWYFVAFQWKRNWFAVLVLAITLCFMILVVRRKTLSCRPKYKFDRALIPVLVVTVFLILITMAVYRSDADDSFYVSNVALFAESGRLNPYDSSFGIEELGTVPMYDFQIWEAFMAVLCRVFRVEAVTMMHTVCLPVLLILSASAYLLLGRVVTKGDSRKAALFYVLMTVFHLFGGYAVYSEGSFLLSRLWQGKAVYLNVALPVMTALILENAEKRRRFLWLELLICMSAGIALNPTSMYVMGFQLFFMLIAISCVRREAKYLLHSIPAVLEVALFTVLIFLRTSKFSGQMEAASVTTETFVKDTFLRFWGSGKLYLLFFAVAVVVIIAWGNKLEKIYIIYTPLALLLGIWNPWMGRVIAEKITMTPSYWRVFWLIPVGQGIAIALIILYEKVMKRKFVRYLYLAAALLLCAVPGRWMFSKENGFIVSNNVEKMPDEAVTFGKLIISENPGAKVLGCDAFSTTLRQKYTDMELIFSRYQYILDLFQYRGEEEQAADRIYLMNIVNGVVQNLSGVSELLAKYQVDYVIIQSGNENLGGYLIQDGWQIREESEQYLLYRK